MSTPIANKKAVPAGPELKYFFEFTGHPGRIYIHQYYFGTHFQVEGVASIRIHSPVTIFHDGQAGWSPLFHLLRKQQFDDASGNRPKLPECLIRAEKRSVDRGVIKTVTWTIYKLKRVEVIHAAKHSNEGGVHYELGFDDFDIVDHEHHRRYYR